jgi:hypothetical protein
MEPLSDRLALTVRKEVASRIPARFQPLSSPDFYSRSKGMIAARRTQGAQDDST